MAEKMFMLPNGDWFYEGIYLKLEGVRVMKILEYKEKLPTTCPACESPGTIATVPRYEEFNGGTLGYICTACGYPVRTKCANAPKEKKPVKV